jgi:hypothetical protein
MKVLTQSEAQSLYTAMTHLNNLDAEFTFSVTNAFGDVTVQSINNGWGVAVLLGDTIIAQYDNQAEFATDYGVSI